MHVDRNISTDQLDIDVGHVTSIPVAVSILEHIETILRQRLDDFDSYVMLMLSFTSLCDLEFSYI